MLPEPEGDGETAELMGLVLGDLDLLEQRLDAVEDAPEMGSGKDATSGVPGETSATPVQGGWQSPVDPRD
jgi:hypothetical protein